MTRHPLAGGRTHHAGQPVIAEPLSYVVSLLPLDHIDAETFWLTVEWRGRDTWAVCRPKRCLGTDGLWDWELQPSSREDDWLATHRFDLATALNLARAAVAEVRINHTTALEILAADAGQPVTVATARAGQVTG